VADEIVAIRIHPAIGIARVGNCDQYFIGPETTGPFATPDGGYKSAGRLKRQAARFRLYGYDKSGQAVREFTGSDAGAEIEWTVTLANKKAAWYNFDRPLDIPESADVRSPRRNAHIRGSARSYLEIRPEPKSITAKSSRPVVFDDGKFMGEPVYLGELRIEDGRLLVLGGRGVARTPLSDNPVYHFANNSGWHDDTSDGPVTARVKWKGQCYEADPGWVVVAPPNYAPDITAVQTLYELIQAALSGFFIAEQESVSFQRDILPLLRNLSNTQWVNYGFHLLFGPGGPYDFFRNGMLERLASNASESEGLRRHVFRLFRNPQGTAADAFRWPPIYGDGYGDVKDGDLRSGMLIAKMRYGALERWAQGNFDSDYTPRSIPSSLEELPRVERPAMMDRAALHFCMGGPFHPGCELTWPLRHASMYRSPFRIRPRTAGQSEPDYGDFMTQAIALAPDGPLSASAPGDLTRWMAVPWHVDTASCLAGYQPEIDPFLPAFWPARVPNHVLTHADYQFIMEGSRKDTAKRQAAFNRRHDWLRRLHDGSPYQTQITRMMEIFGELGVVAKCDGPRDIAGIPSTLYVETGSRSDDPAPSVPPSIAAPPPGGPNFRTARFGGHSRLY
jgi:hypothetical protein